MVIPLALSSGAESISSNFLETPVIEDKADEIAAVKVVFPWSTCPIVPIFTCGFLRLNFSLAILKVICVICYTLLLLLCY